MSVFKEALKPKLDKTYLSKQEASSTYLSSQEAVSTYLPRQEASSTYVSSQEVSSTYLSKQEASSTYALKEEISQDSSATYISIDDDLNLHFGYATITNIILSISESTAGIGDEITLSANVKNENDDVEGVPVQFYINNELISSTVTNSSGIATCLYIPTTFGSKTVRVVAMDSISDEGNIVVDIDPIWESTGAYDDGNTVYNILNNTLDTNHFKIDFDVIKSNDSDSEAYITLKGTYMENDNAFIGIYVRYTDSVEISAYSGVSNSSWFGYNLDYSGGSCHISLEYDNGNISSNLLNFVAEYSDNITFTDILAIYGDSEMTIENVKLRVYDDD